MRFRSGLMTLVPTLLVLRFATALAQAGDPGVTPYALDDSSTFEWGCFGPCACPVLEAPLRGTFDLRRQAPDPLFEHYAVTNVMWKVPAVDGGLIITGSGEYKVGGEFAVQHELSLDLVVGDHSPQHFDSGLVIGGGEFPRIDIEISVHGMQSCRDTVMNVHATPTTAGVADRGALRAFGIERVSPNPFTGRVVVDAILPGAEPADLRIYDLRGRLVRILVPHLGLGAGRHALRWDGKDADGRACAAGLYFLRLGVGKRVDQRASVKL